MMNAIKILLAVLLLLCLFDWPYGYYQTVRFAATTGFALLAIGATKQSRHAEMAVYVLLAFLFQPFIKLSLGRLWWNIVDVVIAVGLLISVFSPKKVFIKSEDLDSVRDRV